MKKIQKLLLMALLFAVMLPMQVLASTQTSVDLDTNGDKAGVRVTLPQDTSKGITALELRINVTNTQKANIDFEFSQNLNATIKESRYVQDSDELVIYIAGAKNMFQDDKAFLGYVCMDVNSDAQVALEVKSNGLQVADGVYGIVQNEIEPENAVIQGQGSSSSSQPDSSSSQPSSQPDSSSSQPSSQPDSSSSSKPSSSSSVTSSSTAGGSTVSSQPSTVGGGQTTQSSQSSTSQKPQSSSSQKQEDSTSESQSKSESESKEQDSQSNTNSTQQSSSQSSSVTQQQKQTADSVVWIAVAVLAVIALAAIGFIVMKNKKAS